MISRYLNRPDRFSRPRRRPDEEPVRNGLAVTPSQMIELTERNIPISAQNLGLTYDEGYSKLDFDVPSEYVRGVDISDLWEGQQAVKDKFRTLRDSGRFAESQPLED